MGNHYAVCHTYACFALVKRHTKVPGLFCFLLKYLRCRREGQCEWSIGNENRQKRNPSFYFSRSLQSVALGLDREHTLEVGRM